MRLLWYLADAGWEKFHFSMIFSLWCNLKFISYSILRWESEENLSFFNVNEIQFALLLACMVLQRMFFSWRSVCHKEICMIIFFECYVCERTRFIMIIKLSFWFDFSWVHFSDSCNMIQLWFSGLISCSEWNICKRVKGWKYNF